MSDVVIRVEDLGKRYRIGATQASYKTLRDSLAGAVGASLRRLRGAQGRREAETIWALKDVSFEVKQGEALGVIGRNGAGKSTLLKVLSRITEPTEGMIELHGRVGSLLEVGTGFHPELSGRENIYLNGAILGMRRREIDRKFDEIVAFSEIEKFLDTPVKHYSSGMYIRLAFAVAAHLEAEVLLVDEVLAVGDAVFQKKCLGKMGDVTKEGRTVLFVSHNLGAVANLCPRTVLLSEGRRCADGPSGEVIAQYIDAGRATEGERVWSDERTAPGNSKLRLRAVRIVCDGKVTSDVDIQKDTEVLIDFRNLKQDAQVSVSIHLIDRMGVRVLASTNMHSANLGRDVWFGRPAPVGMYRSTCVLPGNFLNDGPYSISVYLLTDVMNIEVTAEEVISFTVHDSGGMRKEFGGSWIGVVRPKLAWHTEYLGLERVADSWAKENE